MGHRVSSARVEPAWGLALPCLFLAACSTEVPTESPPELYREPHRPQFHFTPATAWMNDPNGMTYADGEFHLFYQHYPDDTVWGPMHWGHAVSSDLVHWEHLPIALQPDSVGYIFSGSAVVDWSNTAGFQTGDTPPLVAIFTQHDPEGESAGRIDFQTQGIAYSNDRGRSWTHYPGNPVLANPGIRDFRDPKASWHEPSGQWVMVLAAGDHVRFYGSPDLKAWRYLSGFGAGEGAHGGLWECPDLFPLTATDGQTHWVLVVSINPGAPNGGSGTQYFIGDFDGTTFTNGNPPETQLWLDWGRDNYAGVTWSDIPETDGRRLFMGWSSNWDYAQQVPTAPWRSAMTLPRSLTLNETNEGLRISSRPVAEVSRLLRGAARAFGSVAVDSVAPIDGLPDPSVFEATIDFDLGLAADAARTFGIELANASGESYRFGYDREAGHLFSDRRMSGYSGFSDAFATALHVAPYRPSGNRLRFHMFVDRSSVEVFVDEGRITMTELVFPTEEFDRIRLYSEGGRARVIGAVFHQLESIWN